MTDSPPPGFPQPEEINPLLRGMSAEEKTLYAALPDKQRNGLVREIERQLFLMKLNMAMIDPEAELVTKIRRALLTGTPLRVKLGIDPSRPDLHLGHSVVLTKMADMQELGHQAVLIIGDFTASIGDPSGRSAERPVLSLNETKQHAQSYFDQAGLIINMAGAEVHYNSEWLQPMRLEEVLRLSRVTTVARMLERDDFSKRYKAEKPISVAEFLYPLAQGYDSVMVKSDLELGGTDQTFNLLLGREVQRAYGQEPQVILTIPLLPGTDGVDKMSKSADNWIGLTDKPFDKYSKVMSIPDSVMMLYYRLLTKLTPEFFEMLEDDIRDGHKHPMEAKKDLARTVATRYHGLCTAVDVEEHWERQFSMREIPAEVAFFQVTGPLLKDPTHAKVVDILEAAGLTTSKGEGRRLIKQGGVQVDGLRIADTEAIVNLDSPKLIQIGRRQFIKAGL